MKLPLRRASEQTSGLQIRAVAGAVLGADYGGRLLEVPGPKAVLVAVAGDESGGHPGGSLGARRGARPPESVRTAPLVEGTRVVEFVTREVVEAVHLLVQIRATIRTTDENRRHETLHTGKGENTRLKHVENWQPGFISF